MFKPKLLQQEQGFTLVEVLVAILISTTFVAVAMEMIAIAAIFKARAQEFAEATTWIQEDLEEVKYKANQYDEIDRCAPTPLFPNNGYADGLRDYASGISPKTSNINPSPESNDTNSSRTFRTNKSFDMRRTTTPSNTAPYYILEVRYDVSPTSGGLSIAKFYTEVIPNAALRC